MTPSKTLPGSTALSPSTKDTLQQQPKEHHAHPHLRPDGVHPMSAAPAVTVCRSEDGERWIVQIDTGEGTGHVSVDLNDGRIFDGDPEVG